MLSFTLVLSAVVYAQCASALTSLYIPGFNPQPITANELGSQNGVTSYVIAPGVPSGTVDDAGIYGPATLAVGANTAAVTYIGENLGIALYENCDVSNGQSTCEDVVIQMGAEGFTTTTTVTEPVQSFAIQGGGFATGANAISTSPVPTGNFATWTLDLGDDGYPTGTDFPASSGFPASNPTPTPSPSADGSVTASGSAATSGASGISKVPASSGSGSASIPATTGTTSKTSDAAHIRGTGFLTAALAGVVGACFILI